MQDLLNSAENTASIACYLSDKNLANEVVNGISKNNVVSKVTIHSGKTMLAVSQNSRFPHHLNCRSSSSTIRISSPEKFSRRSIPEKKYVR
jgi:hypothetical protein